MSSEEEFVPKTTTTKKIRCTCYSPFQDKRYGPHKRLHNLKNKDKGWRCTVCGTQR